MSLADDIRACRLCAARFAATETRHAPRPVPWFRRGASILVTGQAPGMQVHLAGKPFWDRSGDRLREWMGIDRETFYDIDLISVLPSAFCFPGYRKGADLPPPPICWETWGRRARAEIGPVRLELIIGAHAIRHHMGLRTPMTGIVAGWRDHAPARFPLPHPSWRNTGWLRRNPWFEAELLPALREAVARALDREAPPP